MVGFFALHLRLRGYGKFTRRGSGFVWRALLCEMFTYFSRIQPRDLGKYGRCPGFSYENRVPSVLDMTAPASVKAVFLQIVDVFAGYSVVCVLILKPLQEHPTFAYKYQQPNNIFTYPILAMIKVLVSRN